MKKLAALVVLGIVAVGVTGCGDPNALTESERYELCLDNGGSWVEDAWGESCIMPDVNLEDAEGAEQ